MSDSDDRLKARVEARKQAAAIVELTLSESLAGDAHDAFWQEIRDARP